MISKDEHGKEEYISLRRQIEDELREMAQLERNCVVAIAVVLAWLLRDAPELTGVDRYVGWAIPLAIASFGAMRFRAISQNFSIIGSYIKLLEERNFRGDAEVCGWEHFFNDVGRRGTVGRYSERFWRTLLLGTAVVFLTKALGLP